MMHSGNPALNQNTFSGLPRSADQMSLQGTVNKSFILLALLFIPAAWVWQQMPQPGDLMARESVSMGGYIMTGFIGGLVLALVTMFKKEWSPVSAPLYAAFQGLALGGISVQYSYLYDGIVLQAVGLTMAIFTALLMAYTSGMIRATENFKLGITAATGGIALFYLFAMIAGMFGMNFPMIHGGGIIGIGFSLVVVVIAALNLVMDFDFIEEACERGAPKYMEWYAAFGLIVTLVWLYLEILRLLSKLNSRN